MRALIIAAGLCLASTAATAGPDYKFVAPSAGNLALSNGCVYMPNPSGQAGSYALSYTKAGTTAKCALQVQVRRPVAASPVSQGAAQMVARAQTSLVSYVTAPGIATEPQYIVGAFR